jgi:hypothetical protein
MFIAYLVNDKVVFFKNTIIGLSALVICLFIINFLNPYKTLEGRLSGAMVLIIPFIVSIVSIIYIRGMKSGESLNFKDPKIIIIISLILLSLMILFIFLWKTYSKRQIKLDINGDNFVYSYHRTKDNLDELIF